MGQRCGETTIAPTLSPDPPGNRVARSLHGGSWGVNPHGLLQLHAITVTYCNFKGWIFDAQNQKQGRSEGPMKFPFTSTS